MLHVSGTWFPDEACTTVGAHRSVSICCCTSGRLAWRSVGLPTLPSWARRAGPWGRLPPHAVAHPLAREERIAQVRARPFPRGCLGRLTMRPLQNVFPKTCYRGVTEKQTEEKKHLTVQTTDGSRHASRRFPEQSHRMRIDSTRAGPWQLLARRGRVDAAARGDGCVTHRRCRAASSASLKRTARAAARAMMNPAGNKGRVVPCRSKKPFLAVCPYYIH